MTDVSRETGPGSSIATLHVITDRDRRGAQVHAMDLSEGLARRGHDVGVVALAPGRHGDLLTVDALGPWRRSPATIRDLRRRALSYDLVVAHGSATLSACAIALAGSRVPFVYRQISDPRFWAASPVRRVRVAGMVRRASRVVALSDDIRGVFAAHYRLPSDRLVTIPNAVPAGPWAAPRPEERSSGRRRFDLDDEGVVVVYVGALAPEKGVDAVIDAIAAAGGAELLVVGDGPARADLEALSVRRGVSATFLGSLDDPRPALHAADLLVLASRGGDSMPAVLIEAGLCGLPTLTTPVGAIEDVVVDGRTGVVVPVDDSVALTNAMRVLTENEALRRALGGAARERCTSKFTIDAVTPRWEAMFRSVLHDTSHR